MANRTQKQLHTSRERRLRDLKPAPHKFPIVGLYATELRQHASRPAAQWQAKTQCVALRPVYRSPHWKQVLRCAPSTTRQSRIYRQILCLSFMDLPVYGEAFLLFPPLNGAHFSVEIRSDLFPGVQEVVRPCLSGRFR